MGTARDEFAGSDCCVAIGIASAEYSGHVVPLSGQPANAYGATGGANSAGELEAAHTRRTASSCWDEFKHLCAEPRMLSRCPVWQCYLRLSRCQLFVCKPP